MFDNDIHIRIIPKLKFNVNYQQIYVMYGWELIYQLGGVVGMWAGWSVITVHQLKFEDSKLKAKEIIENMKSLSFQIAIFFINLTKLIFEIIFNYFNFIRVNLLKMSRLLYRKLVIKRVKFRQIRPDSKVN